MDNLTTTPINAMLTYWGNPVVCPTPNPAAFHGTVNTAYNLGCGGGAAPLTGPIGGDHPSSGMRAAMNVGLPSPDSSVRRYSPEDSVRVVSLIAHFVDMVQSNPDSAGDAIPMLSAFVGPSGYFQNALGVAWETYLGGLEQTAPSARLREQAIAFRIQSLIDRNNFSSATAQLDAVLGSSASDELWFFCQSQKVTLYVQQRNFPAAEALFQAIFERGMGINPQGITQLHDLIGIAATGRPSALMAPANTTGKTGQAPAGSSLGQNYPNPFNPVTTIRYTVPVAGKVTLRVFDLLGVEIAKLLDEYKEAGVNVINFDASSLPSGVYFYRLQAVNFVDVKKMLLMK